jgi:predicted MPP superfamily phosphohydrolase
MKFKRSKPNSLNNLKVTTIISSIVLAMGGWMYATKLEPGWLDLSTVSLILPRLHPDFDNYRIIQISDIHMGTWMTPEKLAEAVQTVNMLQPDLIVITGDFVTDLNHRTPMLLERNLKNLKAKDGLYAVLGNHDYWTNAKSIRQILENSGVFELKNDVITVFRGKSRLNIAGVDDYWENKARLHDVIDRLPDQGATVLLAHEPDFAVISAKSGRFDLQLSGHTHGGQVVLPMIGPIVLPLYGRKYPMGLDKIDDMYVYTNRGLGTGKPQIRFNCRPEITLLTLHAPVV